MAPNPPASLAQLPYELRTYIWSLAAEPRRITNVRRVMSTLPFKPKQREKGHDILYETASAPVPTIVQLCREARQHAPYKRAFTAGTEPRWTWVNFTLDVFYVSSIESFDSIKSHRSEIQRIHIRTDTDKEWYENLTMYGAMRSLYEFSNLREVRTVLEPGDLCWAEIWKDWRHVWGSCPEENVTFISNGSSGLVLTGPQLQLVGDWHWVFSFDSEGNPPERDQLSDEISWALDGTHLTLAQMHEID